MAKEINHERRRFIGAAAMTIAAARLSMTDSEQVQADRAKFFREFSMPFYGFNRPGAKVSQGLLDFFFSQTMLCSLPAAYDCIKAFSETDFTEDLKRFDVPTLIRHGDDDQRSAGQQPVRGDSPQLQGAPKLFPGAP